MPPPSSPSSMTTCHLISLHLICLSTQSSTLKPGWVCWNTCHLHAWITASTILRGEKQVPSPSMVHKTPQSLALSPAHWTCLPLWQAYSLDVTLVYFLNCTRSLLSQTLAASYLESSAALGPLFSLAPIFFLGTIYPLTLPWNLNPIPSLLQGNLP